MFFSVGDLPRSANSTSKEILVIMAAKKRSALEMTTEEREAECVETTNDDLKTEFGKLQARLRDLAQKLDLKT